MSFVLQGAPITAGRVSGLEPGSWNV